MVALFDIIASNACIASTFPSHFVAVFVGGTSGVGEYTVKKLAKYAPKSRVYIVGRCQESADRIIRDCEELNPDGKFTFIQADVSLLKNVDDVCCQIKAQETAINVLFLSQGSMAFGSTTSEDLPLASALAIHSRMRFVLNFLPLLQQSTSLRRVVSVLAANCEGPIDTNNMYGENMPLRKWRNQTASIQTLLLEEAARQAPNVSFVHDVPGVVKGGILRDVQGLTMSLAAGLTRLLMPLIETPPDECGERHTFLATSAMYPSREDGIISAGVPLRENMETARGSDGETGSGVYSLDNKCCSAPPKVEQLLAQFRRDGTARKVWEVIGADFTRITGLEEVSD